MQWYCIVTNPNCQRRAQAGLIDRGYRAFYPQTRRWVKHARQRKAKDYPLLGRYLFVEVDYHEQSEQSFGEVRTVDGVESFLSIGNKPLVMPREWVERAMQRYISGEWDFVRQEPVMVNGELRRNPPMPLGALVAVMEGEFANMLAVLTARKNGKVVVLPRGALKPVTMAPDNVRAA